MNVHESLGVVHDLHGGAAVQGQHHAGFGGDRGGNDFLGAVGMDNDSHGAGGDLLHGDLHLDLPGALGHGDLHGGSVPGGLGGGNLHRQGHGIASLSGLRDGGGGHAGLDLGDVAVFVGDHGAGGAVRGLVGFGDSAVLFGFHNGGGAIGVLSGLGHGSGGLIGHGRSGGAVRVFLRFGGGIGGRTAAGVGHHIGRDAAGQMVVVVRVSGDIRPAVGGVSCYNGVIGNVPRDGAAVRRDAAHGQGRVSQSLPAGGDGGVSGRTGGGGLVDGHLNGILHRCIIHLIIRSKHHDYTVAAVRDSHGSRILEAPGAGHAGGSGNGAVRNSGAGVGHGDVIGSRRGRVLIRQGDLYIDVGIRVVGGGDLDGQCHGIIHCAAGQGEGHLAGGVHIPTGYSNGAGCGLGALVIGQSPGIGGHTRSTDCFLTAGYGVLLLDRNSAQFPRVGLVDGKAADGAGLTLIGQSDLSLPHGQSTEGHLVGDIPGRAAGIGGGDGQAVGLEGLAILVFGLAGGAGSGNAAQRISFHGQADGAGNSFVIGAVRGKGPAVVGGASRQGLTGGQHHRTGSQLRTGLVGAPAQGDVAQLGGGVDGVGAHIVDLTHIGFRLRDGHIDVGQGHSVVVRLGAGQSDVDGDLPGSRIGGINGAGGGYCRTDVVIVDDTVKSAAGQSDLGVARSIDPVRGRQAGDGQLLPGNGEIGGNYGLLIVVSGGNGGLHGVAARLGGLPGQIAAGILDLVAVGDVAVFRVAGHHRLLGGIAVGPIVHDDGGRQGRRGNGVGVGAAGKGKGIVRGIGCAGDVIAAHRTGRSGGGGQGIHTGVAGHDAVIRGGQLRDGRAVGAALSSNGHSNRLGADGKCLGGTAVRQRVVGVVNCRRRGGIVFARIGLTTGDGDGAGVLSDQPGGGGGGSLLTAVVGQSAAAPVNADGLGGDGPVQRAGGLIVRPDIVAVYGLERYAVGVGVGLHLPGGELHLVTVRIAFFQGRRLLASIVSCRNKVSIRGQRNFTRLDGHLDRGFVGRFRIVGRFICPVIYVIGTGSACGGEARTPRAVLSQFVRIGDAAHRTALLTGGAGGQQRLFGAVIGQVLCRCGRGQGVFRLRDIHAVKYPKLVVRAADVIQL